MKIKLIPPESNVYNTTNVWNIDETKPPFIPNSVVIETLHKKLSLTAPISNYTISGDGLLLQKVKIEKANRLVKQYYPIKKIEIEGYRYEHYSLLHKGYSGFVRRDIG